MPNAIAPTSEQLLPDTAVRCESDDAFMSASSSFETPLVSPTDSPGKSPAPGSGRPWRTRSTKPRRSWLVTANTCWGGARTFRPSAKTTATAASPGSAGSPPPETDTTDPRSSPSGGGSARSRTLMRADPSGVVAVPSKRTPPVDGSTFVVTVTARSVTRPSRAAATAARSAWTIATCAEAIPAAAQATATRGRSRARRPGLGPTSSGRGFVRRCRTSRIATAANAAAVEPQSSAATPGAHSGRRTDARAAPHVAPATGIMRKSRGVTPSPGRAAIREPWARCRRPRADRRPFRRAPRCRANR